jgi:hypothetical protein
MTLTIWTMVHDNDAIWGVKERKNNEKIISFSELQEMVNDVVELENENHEAYNYLFNDFLVVNEGVYKWSEESKKFIMIIDKQLTKDVLKAIREESTNQIEYQRNEFIREIIDHWKNK